MISEELAGFLESGNSIHIATRDRRMVPYGVRMWAVKVDDDRVHLTGFVPAKTARRVVANLRSNSQVSFGFARPTDNRACQLKGVFVSSRPGTPRDRPIVKRQVEAFTRELRTIGIPESVTRGWLTWPCVAVKIRVTDLFSQTPGPGAGARMP
jgi:pyridoxamine 5'-phosphate oxidase-like protein